MLCATTGYEPSALIIQLAVTLHCILTIKSSPGNMDDEKTIKIQKLKGASTYRIWSSKISAHLEGKRLLNVSLGNELRPNGSNERPRTLVRNPRPKRNH